MTFVELAARSSFSFLRGASHPEEVVDTAKSVALEGIAICDRDGLYGAARAHARAKEIGQTIYVGAEVPLALSELDLQRRISPNEDLQASEARACQLLRTAKPNALRKRFLVEDRYPAVLLLAQDSVGYQNLCWLLTRAHADLPKGECLLDVEDFEGHTAGLTALIPAALDALTIRAAAPCLDAPRDAFPERMLERLRDFFAASAHTLMFRRLTREDAVRMAIAKSRERHVGLSIVASARPLYHCKSRKRLADVMQCIRLGTTLDEAKTQLSANGQAYLRSAAQMRRLFRDQLDWVERTAGIAERLSFRLDQLRYHFPCRTPPGESPDDYLKRVSWEGARRRYPSGIPEKVQQQMRGELALIQSMGMAPYFLSTWEIVELARERGILCQGRGSAANSAVCYALGVTAVNPECSNLLFERFMSPERREPPDIDVDFEHERREEVIQEIYRRYGRERAAMVSEVICYRRKSALREVSKVFGLSLEQSARLAGAFSHWDDGRNLDIRLRLRDAGLNDATPRMRGVMEIAEQLVGFPRHLSIHVGGFVVSSRPLFEVAPVEPARMEDRSIIPWDKDDLDVLGFFKIDVLALGMLSAVRKALELVWQGGGLRAADALEQEDGFDPLDVITRIPDEDPAVYAMTARADTVGVFQIESRAQMAMLPRLRPERFYDLVIEVAIVRPGPIQGGMVHPYLRRRNGEEAPDCHPLLRPILIRTLGVPLFQEQVMQIAIVGAGYSGGEADQLRRDMAAWRKTGRLLRHRQRLIEGFERNGIDRRFGEALFEQIKGFGEYGFPESHAASFALLVYKSAWLKAHYPAHFVCAVLNAQPMGFYSPASLVKDAQAHGVEVRPVCVLASEWDCTLEEPSRATTIRSRFPDASRAVRLGFRQVKGLSRAGAERLLNARAAFSGSARLLDGALRIGLAELTRRAALSKGDFEALAEAGAFSRLEAERRQVLWSAAAPRQLGLFANADIDEPRAHLPRLEAIEVLALDYRRVRLSLHDHPLKHLRESLRERSVLTTAEVAASPTGTRASVAGLVTARQRPGTASGVVFITLEDETGIANLVLYSRIFDNYRRLAQHAALMLVHGKVERQDPDPRVLKPQDPRQADGVASIIHVIVESLEPLELPGPALCHASRDFR